MDTQLAKYDCLLFDFDGTLVPSLDYWLSGFKHAFQILGYDLTEEEIIAGCFYRGDKAVAEHFGIECHQSFWQLVQHKIMTHYDQAELFDGVREVLDFCRASKIPLGLVTSSERPVIEKAFHHLKLDGYFDAVVTASDVEHCKPNPEPVLKALKILGKEPVNDHSKVLFIGDYIVDVQAGRAAGVSTALYFADCHRRFHAEEHVMASAPDFMFNSYADLFETLKRDLGSSRVN
ncbi:MAG: HAD family hydrolase [Candidatus Obscuribacter sp.]|jgi:pyrophosphatase PpaX|nr:HAD family hydrolase [Candidatus Obscuribacter sp.]MBK9205570.1 HAD family hydrolase [Candidatus Obscuribacter sp.]MBK9617640.1 HAD family hydrolase [Candidatus Obscuribacter sp.]MBK9773102.1 HAD family hydrolase [Candidatus Obscuribacter sp.]